MEFNPVALVTIQNHIPGNNGIYLSNTPPFCANDIMYLGVLPSFPRERWKPSPWLSTFSASDTRPPFASFTHIIHCSSPKNLSSRTFSTLLFEYVYDRYCCYRPKCIIPCMINRHYSILRKVAQTYFSKYFGKSLNWSQWVSCLLPLFTAKRVVENVG